MKFGIIGFGRFGQLWANLLASYGEVFVYDKNTIPSFQNDAITCVSLPEVTKADVLFLLTPISQFKDACLAVKKTISPSTLVVDCCSVKMHSVRILGEIFLPSQPLLATHPLFGPDSVKKSNGIKGHTIVICPFQPENKKTEQLYALFKKMGLEILFATAEEHDKQMASSQGLVHFLGRGLLSLNLHPQILETPDFKALLHINTMVANDTWQLFLDMHRYNPFVKEIRHTFINQLLTLNQRIEENHHGND